MSNKVFNGSNFSSVIKGGLLALTVSLIGVLILAFIISVSGINGVVVKAVNQFIKILSVFIGCFICLSQNKGFVKGLLVGLIYVLLIFLVFAITGAKLTLKNFFIDLIFLSVIGILSGIITVNVKKN